MLNQHKDATIITMPRFKQLSMPSFFQHFAWTWMRPFMVIFLRVKIKGRENLIGLKSNVIIASNHTNEFDPIFIVASLPFFSQILPLAYVSRSKDFYAQMPRGSMYGGKFFELMGAYPVYPGLKDYEKSLQHHLDAAKHGRSVGIFPMGKRHGLADISQARGGVSYLAYKTGLPIIPMRIDGISSLRLIDCLKFKYRMTVTFGKPLFASDIFGKKLTAKNMESHNACEKAAVVIMKRIIEL
jgi:1-acyl-sn-glycerol-3-phosphate acyltransferase